MFKLEKLFSESGLFDKLPFKNGLNIILGKYSNAGKDINGIGKTTIINLIDYCLLADGPKTNFRSSKYSFLSSHTVSLQFIIGKTHYIIERDFKNYSEATLYKNGQLVSDYNEKDLRLILGKTIISNDTYEGIFDSSWYRTIMSFFIQDDHSFLARTAKDVMKFVQGGQRKSELLFYNLYLFGINNNKIWEFDDRRIELKQNQNVQTQVRKKIKEDTGKNVDEFKAEIESTSRKISEYEKDIKKYHFLDLDEKVESQIEEINKQISTLNKQHVKYKQMLQTTRESLDIKVEVDVEKVAQNYRHLHREFSEFIKKELTEVLEFRKAISSNRKRFIKEREINVQNNMETIESKLVSLERTRSELYKRLDQKNAFEALHNAYRTLTEEKTNHTRNKVSVDQLNEIEKNIADTKSKISDIVKDLVQCGSNILDEIADIKQIFHELIENSVDLNNFDTPPYFSIDPRSNITSPLQLKIEVPRSGSLGKGRLKILAYDLTIFLNLLSSERTLPTFLIHDGVFHGIAHKTRIMLLNYLYEKLKMHKDSQYIITLNEDEIYLPEQLEISKETFLNFDILEESIIVLEDSPEKMFFHKEFG